MAHEIESMMYLGETPWHGLGTKVLEAPSAKDAMRLAGLDWEVGMRDLVTAADLCYGGGEKVSHRATFRKTDGKILGVVGPAYEPLQNADAFAFFDPIVSSGEASFETAGSLREGKRIWILAKLNRDPSVIVRGSNDIVNKYVLLSNAHDGTLAIRCGFTPIRVVCANTLAMAHNDKASKLLKMRHHRGMDTTLAAIREAMNLADQTFEATADAYRFLASRHIDEATLKMYVNQVFAPKRAAELAKKQTGLVLAKQVYDAEFIEEEAPEQRSRVFADVQRLFESGRGNNLPGVRGTFWAAYNAITEYVSYERGGDNDLRLDSTWFGSGAAVNRRALEVGMSLAA